MWNKERLSDMDRRGFESFVNGDSRVSMIFGRFTEQSVSNLTLLYEGVRSTSKVFPHATAKAVAAIAPVIQEINSITY